MKVQNINNQQDFRAKINIISCFKNVDGKFAEDILTSIDTSPEQDIAIIEGIVHCQPCYPGISKFPLEKISKLKAVLERITGIELNKAKPNKLLFIGTNPPTGFCFRFGDMGNDVDDVKFEVSGEEFVQRLREIGKTLPKPDDKIFFPTADESMLLETRERMAKLREKRIQK